MGKIVIIGGGELGTYQTLHLDKRVVELTKQKHPKALFIPTASGEPEGYCNTFHKVYGKKLGCKTDVLKIIHRKPRDKELRDKILGSDLIYVGGGNTLKMMKRWKFLGIDRLLRKAYKEGVVLSGISAGGICWFDSGHSDSRSFNNKNWRYINVRGLGLIKGIHCPHFDGETRGKPRRKWFKDFMKKYHQMGIAVENRAGIEFINGKYRVLSGRKNRKAYRVYKVKGKIKVEEIPKKKELRPVAELYKK